MGSIYAKNMCMCSVLACLCLGMGLAVQANAEASRPEARERSNAFEVAGLPCILLAPVEAAPGKPWLWRTTTPDAEALVDRILLERGFHIAYMDVGLSYGNPKGVRHWQAFYDWLTLEEGLSSKPALAAKGPGALILYNWLAENTDQAACVLAIAPWVQLDALRPRLIETGQQAVWDAIAAAHQVVSGEAIDMSLAHAATIGEAEIPIMHLCVAHDAVAPLSEHTRPMYAAYRRAGRGVFEVIELPEVNEQDGEEEALAMLHFLLTHTGQLPAASTDAPMKDMPQWRAAEFAGGAGVRLLNDVLIIERGNDMTGAAWLGTLPQLDYEIELEAMRLSGNDFFCGLTAPYEESVFSLIIGGWGGTCVGISSLDWLDAYHNDTAHFYEFDTLRWYHIRLRVSKDKLEAWIDKEKVVDVDIADRDVDIRWEMAPTKPLGIATWRTTGAIRNFQVRQL